MEAQKHYLIDVLQVRCNDTFDHEGSQTAEANLPVPGLPRQLGFCSASSLFKQVTCKGTVVFVVEMTEVPMLT